MFAFASRFTFRCGRLSRPLSRAHLRTDAATGAGPCNSGLWRPPESALAKSRVGKRGGLRVIYYWAAGEQAFYMLYAYTKSEQGDLTAAQTRQLSRVVREEFK